MKTFTDRLRKIFTLLDQRITILNQERKEMGSPQITCAQIELLGQMSLLSNEMVSHQITLADTADMDAHLKTEYVVEKELRRLLQEHGLIYDESSGEVWIPPNTRFEPLFNFSNVVVTRIDPESALVSKAVKAREKNRILIQEAIATNIFPKLTERIEKNGGDITYFLEESP